MSLFITAFGAKLLLCLVFTLFCFLIAWPVGLYFRYKDSQKMKAVLRDQPVNRRRYWLKQFSKLSISIVVLYFISFLIALYFEMPFSSTAPFVGLFALLIMLYIKFAPRTTGEVTPDVDGWYKTSVIIDPDEYFTSTGATIIFGSFIFTAFEFISVVY
ncbi:hypothetical protein [Bacillus sp. AFS041924]|uniref:hypothetical protein n=1 Tax=Bacillus sp. AFS041924 TaxID=2033503 RepID=UPI000BFE797D|nr:hypothetical protein [Bacillus sp. AFS041924]PGS56401.1 hypothetical protein COC46_01450 [Bacillus sp. AFS041924]